MHYSEEIQQTWLKISIIADPAIIEALSDYLIGVTGAAVEIGVDDTFLCSPIHAFLEQGNIDAVQTSGILEQLSEYAKELADIFQVPVPEITSSIIQEEDWGNTWKKHFRPFAIIPGLVIKPTWEEYVAGKDEQVIELDPGMVFGTGHHATTALCLELLHTILIDRSTTASVLDVGTGTGILGMAAALFGAGRVVGIDNDPEAVAAAFENINRNGLADRMTVVSTPLSILQEPFSIIVANILHDVLLDMANDLRRILVDDGDLILSGILTEKQGENIIDHFVGRGFSLISHRKKNEWSALLFKKAVTGVSGVLDISKGVN
jgi:ribosomal protein L11 methyltransferase